MMPDASPTARALVALELIQDSPGISAERLAGKLGVSERATRRYVAILREAGVPIDSERGRYGGYRVGRGLRVPPLMFSMPEALGLVMAVLEGRHGAADSADPVATALGKIIRVLPGPVAESAEAVRRGSARRGGYPDDPIPSPETTAQLVRACAAQRRIRIGYRGDRVLDVDPWAVVVRHARWYLLCWSHTADARRVLRVDRVGAVDQLEDGFTPPAGLDPARVLEEHLSEGWKYPVEVVIEAPADTARRWLRPNLGRVEPIDDGRSRLVASTDEPDWYAQQLTVIKAPFRIVGPPELCAAATELGRRLSRAALDRYDADVHPRKELPITTQPAGTGPDEAPGR
jgi:predicted DNA-binding transcriptional regulator YafY